MTTEIVAADSGEAIKEAVARAVALLEAGEVVAVPTETVYGLAADALNASAVAKIFEAKERPSFDPLIVHVNTRETLEKVAEVPEEIAGVVAQLAENIWPGPLTMVLPKKEVVPDVVTAGLPTVAVRMSADPVFRKIIGNFGGALAAPSANRFGRVSPTSASAVFEELEGRIPLIVDAGACLHGLESTIIRIEPPEKNKPMFHILRPGPLGRDELMPYGKLVWPKKKRGEDVGNAPQTPEVPGQLASHYAPMTPLRFVEEEEEFVPEEGKRYGFLSYKGEGTGMYADHAWEEIETLSPGAGKMPEAAVRLFFLMRKLDAAGVDEIVAEALPARGLGIAINDRLRRASVR